MTREATTTRRRVPWFRLGFTLSITGLAYVLVFEGTSLSGLRDEFQQLKPGWLLASIALVLLLQGLRLLRWGVLLAAVGNVPAGVVVRVGSIGTMAVDILPLRLGELVRPGLLDRLAGVPFITGAATIIVERLLDVLALLAILGIAIGVTGLPTETASLGGWTIDLEVARGALLLAVSLLGLPLAGLILARTTTLRWAERVLRLLPDMASAPSLRWVTSFADSVEKLGTPRPLLWSGLLSLMIWGVGVLVAWALMQASPQVQLGLIEAAVVTLFVAVALLMPAPAGGLGVFEAGAVVGLGLYGITGAPAALFAVALHAVHLGTITLLGVVCLAWEGIHWRELIR